MNLFEWHEVPVIIMVLVAIALVAFKIAVMRHDPTYRGVRTGVIVSSLYVIALGIMIILDRSQHDPVGVMLGSVAVTLFMVWEIIHSIRRPKW